MPDPFDAGTPKVTVIIPNWNGLDWLGDCLKNLAGQNMQGFHTIVVDNGSSDGSVAFIERQYPRVEIIELASNTGFANAVNVGIERSASPYVALLNADTQVYPDWLSTLLKAVENCPPDIGAVNSQLLRLDDRQRIDDAGDELSWYGAAIKRGHNQPAAKYHKQEEISSPCAAASLYRRDFLLRTGGFDAGFFAYLEDVDLGLRGRLLGYRYLYEPNARVLHKGHGAELPHGRYVELITRNRLFLFAKNIPTQLLLRHAGKLLYGQLYFMILYAQPWSSIKGYLRFFAALPRVMRKRRRILKETALTMNEIDRLLHARAPEPRLRDLARRYMSRLFGW